MSKCDFRAGKVSGGQIYVQEEERERNSRKKPRDSQTDTQKVRRQNM